MVSIIVPCYNESDAIPYFYAEIIKTAEQINDSFEFLFINDGSKDSTISVIKELAKKDDRVKYISFSRNFGKEAAIYAGLENCKGDYAAIMDADLQDPPALLPEMYELVSSGEYDSVGTRRVNRKGEPPIRSFFARRFYGLMRKISKTELVDGARDYRLMNRKFVNAVLALGEYNRFSKGLFGWVGFKNKWIEFENVERVAGETKWSFWKLLVYAIDGIVAFSTTPLELSAVLGVLLSFFAFILMIFIFVRRLVFGDPVDGWASTVCIIVFLGGLQLFFTGVLGQYLAKTYLEVKKRPIYISDEDNIDK